MPRGWGRGSSCKAASGNFRLSRRHEHLGKFQSPAIKARHPGLQRAPFRGATLGDRAPRPAHKSSLHDRPNSSTAWVLKGRKNITLAHFCHNSDMDENTTFA